MGSNLTGMIDRTTRLRWRRRFRRSKHQVEDISYQAEEQLERHFFKRLSRLPGVWRFTGTWILLLVLLIGGVIVQTRALAPYYLTAQPTPGGIFTEGIRGSFTNANPLYATNDVDKSVARLLFANLFKYNQKNQLVGDLADSWKITDDRAVRYVVHLRENLKWQDGRALTAADVVFTYKLIQNPDAKSPLAASWQGITVTAEDPQTVTFTLPNPLSAFPFSMTNGIVPKHILENVPVAQLRSINFNTARPIGSGSFKWEALQVSGLTPETREEQIALVPNPYYYGQQPKLSRFIIRSFRSDKRLLESLKKQELNGVAGMEELPYDLQQDTTIHQYEIPLLGEVMVFLKNSNEILADAKVRRAIVLATDVNQAVATLGYPVITARGPLLKSHVGYDKTITQASFNPEEAKRLLDEAGWQVDARGWRVKAGKVLTFGLYSQDNRQYKAIAQNLKKQWQAVGISLEVILQSDTDLQTTLSSHAYDALLYGVELGSDPDVFAYWHSSQADPRAPQRLNFAEYKSSTSDVALEAGRTRIDASIRAIKYRPFLETWRNDAPAIALYQPRFLYVTRGKLFGFELTTINSGADRYANVENWMIHEQKTIKP